MPRLTSLALALSSRANSHRRFECRHGAIIEAGNDLGVVYEQTQAHAKLIADFLKGLGLEDAEQSLSPPKIQDYAAEGDETRGRRTATAPRSPTRCARRRWSR